MTDDAYLAEYALIICSAVALAFGVVAAFCGLVSAVRWRRSMTLATLSVPLLMAYVVDPWSFDDQYPVELGRVFITVIRFLLLILLTLGMRNLIRTGGVTESVGFIVIALVAFVVWIVGRILWISTQESASFYLMSISLWAMTSNLCASYMFSKFLSQQVAYASINQITKATAFMFLSLFTCCIIVLDGLCCSHLYNDLGKAARPLSPDDYLFFRPDNQYVTFIESLCVCVYIGFHII